MSLYYKMVLLQNKQTLLQQADSLFASFLQRQEQRFKVGDVNILERTAAETAQKGAANQLRMLEADLKIVQAQFGYWLNTSIDYLPEAVPVKLMGPQMPYTAVLEQLPMLQWKEQQSNIALNEWKVYKSKNLPLLQLGYSNQSIRGYQNVDGTEKYFSASKRFSAVNAGLQIPIFNQAGKARVKAGKWNYEAARSNYAQTEQEQKTRLKELWLGLHKQQQELVYYESALKQADTLFSHAQLQYQSGAISYLEWMMLVNQSIAIRAGYFDALANWNQTVIEISLFSPEFIK
jgi:cobalt-zinc-cadmium resistance protein CzcA